MAKPLSDPKEKLYRKINVVDSGCWEWTGFIDNDGYARMSHAGEIRAHRISYRVHKGEIPNGILVCHTCDNRKCVNPNHLFLGNHSDNAVDMVKKERSSVSKVSLIEAGIIKEAGRKFTRRAVARYFGISHQSVTAIVNSKHFAFL